jgi:hypothetical protein
MATKKNTFKAGDQIVMRGEITSPDGDERTGERTVVVRLDGYDVPIRTRIDNVEKAAGQKARYFLEEN